MGIESMGEGFPIKSPYLKKAVAFYGLRMTRRGVAVMATAVSVLSTPALYAQNVAVDLMNRVAALEAEQRELRGALDETRHDLSLLQKKMDTLNADVDYRLTQQSPGDKGPSKLSDEIDSFAPTPREPLDAGSDSPAASAPEKEYEHARALLEKGDYEAAEKAFSAFLKAHPKHDQAGAAQYWLGVTYFVRGEHERAAASFAKGYKNYPKSSKASDGLLKLSKSLVALDRKADACATLEQLSSDFPKSHAKEVERERKKLKCK